MRDDPGAEANPPCNTETGPEEGGCEDEPSSSSLHVTIGDGARRHFGLSLTVKRGVLSSVIDACSRFPFPLYNGGGRPHRLAWSRTRPSQGRNRGSNPLGATRFIQSLPIHLQEKAEGPF